ncbi:ionotropic receptor 75a-like [Culex pipiens pallens]|uniref:ionotropic receptor 75a-like n=1 Tax=Culex pipiens pallens TaxID=42434 RepID=UPI001953497A|nr:ionotropic receptor 75a-like [Culex pipiens pallens]
MDNYLSLTEPAKNYVANRLGYRTVKLLGVLLNFRVVHILTTEWGFDVVGTNSTKGIIGQLQQNFVDLSSAPLAITSERMQSFEQTIDLVTRRIITIFRHPKNGGSRNIFLHPFQNMLWLGIVLVLLFSSGFLLFSCFVKRQRSQGRCSNFLLLIFGFFCQQSYAGSTTIYPSRMVLLTMLLFSLTVYQFYSCFIIGYLLVLPPKNIRSIEQLIESNLGFSIEDVPYNRDYFNRTKNPLARELYEKKVLNSDVGFINVSLGVDLIKRGKHAFHCDTSYVNTWIMESFSDYEQCELQEIETYPTRPLQIVIPKGSPLKEPFRVSIRLMMDTGLVQYYRRKFFMKRPPCSTDSFATVKVGFWDIAGLYWLLVAGFTMSAFVLAVEILEFRVRMHFWDKEFSKRYTGWHN